MIFHTTTDRLRLGLGGAPLGNLFSAITDEAARAVLDAAWASGCRTFDTAPHYGNGLSEHRFGQALQGRARDDFVLSTKVGRLLRPDASTPRSQNSYVDVLPFAQSWDYSAAGVRRSVEDSLQRLGLARLDVAYIHDCDAGVHADGYARVLAQVIDQALPELRQMQREGLVSHIGLGVNDVQVCLDVLRRADLDCLMLAGRYSLIDQSALAELLPMCTERKVRIALGGVFNSGILATGVRNNPAARFDYAQASRKWVDQVAQIEDICLQYGVPLRAAALQFPLAHPAIEIVMLGAQQVEHWLDGLAMMRRAIPAAFWASLRERGLLAAQVPAPQSA